MGTAPLLSPADFGEDWARLDSNQGPRDYEKTGLSNPCWPSMTYTCH